MNLYLHVNPCFRFRIWILETNIFVKRKVFIPPKTLLNFKIIIAANPLHSTHHTPFLSLPTPPTLHNQLSIISCRFRIIPTGSSCRILVHPVGFTEMACFEAELMGNLLEVTKNLLGPLHTIQPLHKPSSHTQTPSIHLSHPQEQLVCILDFS